MQSDNRYTQMQKAFYNANAPKMAETDHKEHDSNPHYWDILLGDLDDDWYENDKSIKALDIGCGTGRNVRNLVKNWIWNSVHGIDISENNIKEAYNKLGELVSPDFDKCKLYVNNGIDLKPLEDNTYDFVMSTIVLQHICVYDIRFSLLSEAYRVMKEGGLFSFQMGYGNSPGTVGYYENHYDANSTNSDCDVRVDDPTQILNDLIKIGFKNITYEIQPSWSNQVHNQWIYVKAYK